MSVPLSPSASAPSAPCVASTSTSAAEPERSPTPSSPSETINPQALLVRSIPGRGRGVFASRDLRAGELLEDAPVLVLTREQWEQGRMDDTVLGEYGFCWSNGGMALGLGIASLFNHSSSPNVNFIRNTSGDTITFRTSRSVAAGDELCICYSADETKLWFVPSGAAVRPATPSEDGDGTEVLAALSLSDAESDEQEEKRREREERKRLALAKRVDPSAAASSASSATRDGADPAAEPDTHADGSQTRREKGGATHAAREKRREKYRLKMEKKAEGAGTGEAVATLAMSGAAAAGAATLVAPRPVVATGAFPSSSTDSSLAQSQPTTSQLSPSATDGATISASDADDAEQGPQSVASRLAARRRRNSWRAPLPPALHADGGRSRHEQVGPAKLTTELEWEPAADTELPEERWGVLRRARGPIEIEEEAEDDNSATIDVWIVDVQDPKLTRFALAFTKEGLPVDARMRHLKRVRRVADPSGDHNYIALAMTDSLGADELASALEAYNPLLAGLVPTVAAVPRCAARTQEQLRARAAMWPVLFSPGVPRLPSARAMSASKLAWVEAGIQRVLSDARAAKVAGELPVAVYCASPPEAIWPTDGSIPPTPGLRAASHDTRVAEAHPLRHAVLNCIAEIARLRTAPPFSEMQPARNGADYLLTSTSLFVTHEPCVMCAMALVHSRVREVFFVFPRTGGGFEGSFGVHSRRDLNHRFDAWQWCGQGVDAGEFALPDGVEV